MLIQFNQQTRTPPVGTLRRPAVDKRINLTGDVYDDTDRKVVTHAADPIKSIEDIWKVQDYFISNERYRDNLLFTCGINFGYRISDLLTMKVGDLLSSDGTSYRPSFVIKEKKTQKMRQVYLNDAVMDAADLYFNHVEGAISLNDYLFTSNSNNSQNIGKPLNIRSVNRMLEEVINQECGLGIHASSHCLRKTFAYHVIVTAKDRPRAVEFLQKLFNHSSQSITLMYAGITDEEIATTYQHLNLGRGFNWNRSSGFAAVTGSDAEASGAAKAPAV